MLGTAFYLLIVFPLFYRVDGYTRAAHFSYFPTLTHTRGEVNCSFNLSPIDYVVTVWNKESNQFFSGAFISEIHVLVGARFLQGILRIARRKYVDPSTLLLFTSDDLEECIWMDGIMQCPEEWSIEKYGIRIVHYTYGAMRDIATPNVHGEMAILETERHGRTLFSCIGKILFPGGILTAVTFSEPFNKNQLYKVLDQDRGDALGLRCGSGRHKICENHEAIASDYNWRNNLTYGDILTQTTKIQYAMAPYVENYHYGYVVGMRTGKNYWIAFKQHNNTICMLTGVCEDESKKRIHPYFFLDGKYSLEIKEPFCDYGSKMELISRTSPLKHETEAGTIQIRRLCGERVRNYYGKRTFPFVASLNVHGPSNSTHGLCSAVLISSLHLLASSECIPSDMNNGSELFATFNEKPNTKASTGTQDNSFQNQWKVHRFVVANCSETSCPKVAILQLERHVEYTGNDSHLRPICLPTKEELPDMAYIVTTSLKNTSLRTAESGSNNRTRDLDSQVHQIHIVNSSSWGCEQNEEQCSYANAAPIFTERDGFYEVIGIAEREATVGHCRIQLSIASGKGKRSMYAVHQLSSFICAHTGICAHPSIPFKDLYSPLFGTHTPMKRDSTLSSLNLLGEDWLDQSKALTWSDYNKTIQRFAVDHSNSIMRILLREENEKMIRICEYKFSGKKGRMVSIKGYDYDTNTTVSTTGVFISHRHILCFLHPRLIERIIQSKLAKTSGNENDGVSSNNLPSIRSIIEINNKKYTIIELENDVPFYDHESIFCIPKSKTSFRKSSFVLATFDENSNAVLTTLPSRINPVTNKTEPKIPSEMLNREGFDGVPIFDVQSLTLWALLRRINVDGEEAVEIIHMEEMSDAICRVTGLCPNGYMLYDEEKIPRMTANGEKLCGL